MKKIFLLFILTLLSISAFAQYVVSQDTDGIKINDPNSVIPIGMNLQLSATDSEGGNILWESENIEIATVSDTGLITGIGEGMCKIYAKRENDLYTYDFIYIRVYKHKTDFGSADWDAYYLGSMFLDCSVGDLLYYDTSICEKVLYLNKSKLTYDSYTVYGWEEESYGYKSYGKYYRLNAGNYRIKTELDPDTLILKVKIKSCTPETYLDKYQIENNKFYVTYGRWRQNLWIDDYRDQWVNLSIDGLESVKLDKHILYLKKGESAKLNATVISDIKENVIKYYSNKSSVASVDSNGNVTANNIGEATIGVWCYGGLDKEDLCKVIVEEPDIPVTSIKISKSSLSFDKDKTAKLTATVYPTNATDRTVTWTSDNENVATVDNKGNVTGVGAGSSTITATTNGLDKNGNKLTVTCEVTVNIPVTSIKISKSSLSLDKGKTAKLTATVYPTNATDRTVTWTSSNKNVATVDNKGNITGIEKGTATITVTSNGKDKNGKQLSVTCKVTVNDPTAKILIKEIILNKTSFTLFNKCTFTLKATTINPSNATNKTLKWTSNKTSVATVDPNSGKVTAKAVGTATITCSATDGSEVKTTCTVKVIEPVTKIDLNKYTLALKTGKTFKIIATVTPSNSTYKKVTWVSSNTSVAIVGTTGIVTAKGVGKCEITAIAKDGSKIQSKPCVVTVTDPTVTLNKNTLTLNVGKTFKLIATVNLTNKKVTWSSSDSKIATVGSTGIVKGIKKGTVTITAKSVAKPSEQATCVVIVK